MSKSTLIIGGARSGKSHFALELALKSGTPVLFVATATAGDEEMRQRIEAHRKARPATWNTLEATTHIGSQIQQKAGGAGTIIVDCITLLVNNLFIECTGEVGEQINAVLIEKRVTNEIDELIACISRANASFVIVTNEVGSGIVPADSMTRLYRDLLGKANQMLARHVDEIYLMVAGIPLLVKPSRAI